MNHPKNLQEAYKLLPPSVKTRLGGGCQSLQELEVCCRVVERLGGWAVVLVAMECYVIPVQTRVMYSLEDLVWYVCMTTGYEKCTRVKRADDMVGNNVWALFRACKAKHAKFNARKYVSRLSCARIDSTFAQDSAGCWWSGESDLDVYPRKESKGWNKVNVYFKDVWKDVVTYNQEIGAHFAHHLTLSVGMLNDQASSWLIWLTGAVPNCGMDAYALCAVFSGRPKHLKALNTVGKAIGCQKHVWGRDICELTTLAGRGVAPVDPDDDVRTRVELEPFLEEKAAVCDPVLLRKCIKNGGGR